MAEEDKQAGTQTQTEVQPKTEPGVEVQSDAFKYSTGLCDICDDPKQSLLGCCCPCLLFGKNAEYVSNSKHFFVFLKEFRGKLLFWHIFWNNFGRKLLRKMFKKGWHPRRLLSQLYRTFRARDRPTLLVLKKKFQSFVLIFHVLRRRSLPKFKILFEMSNVFNFQIINYQFLFFRFRLFLLCGSQAHCSSEPQAAQLWAQR